MRIPRQCSIVVEAVEDYRNRVGEGALECDGRVGDERGPCAEAQLSRAGLIVVF